MNYSTEQLAKIVQVAFYLLAFTGIKFDIPQEQLVEVIGALIFVASTIYLWIKRYSRGDLTILGGRKDENLSA